MNDFKEEHFLSKEDVNHKLGEVLAPSNAGANELASHSAGQVKFVLKKSFQNGRIRERPLVLHGLPPNVLGNCSEDTAWTMSVTRFRAAAAAQDCLCETQESFF